MYKHPPRQGDLPFDECVKKGAEHILAGRQVHQKWTCGHCGARNTMDIPNKFYRRGKCEDCGNITKIDERGCGFMLIIGPL